MTDKIADITHYGISDMIDDTPAALFFCFCFSFSLCFQRVKRWRWTASKNTEISFMATALNYTLHKMGELGTG